MKIKDSKTGRHVLLYLRLMNRKVSFSTHTKNQLARGQQQQRTKLVPVKTWQRKPILAEGIEHPIFLKQDLRKLQSRTYFLKTRIKYFTTA